MNKNQFLFLVFSLLLIFAGILYFRRSTEIVPQPVPVSVTQITATGSMEIAFKNVNYFNKTTGFYAYPVDKGDYPGVVMIHEWWGLNDNIRDMAKKLASHGYRVMAVDLFNGKVAQNMQQAQQFVTSINESVALQNLKSALKYLKSQGASKNASFGWCFGGGQSLRFSLNESDLSATVIYYGELSTDSAKLKKISGPVLGIFGDSDTSIPVGTVKNFESGLNKLGIVNEIYIYKGVGHAFANPTGPNYAPEATVDAWNKTLKFLDKYLK